MHDASDAGQATSDQPRKRVAIGDGISAGSGSPVREGSKSPSPRRSKAIPTLAPYGMASDVDSGRQDMFGPQRPRVEKKHLWSPEQDSPPKTSFDPSNVASVVQRSRAQVHRSRPSRSLSNHYRKCLRANSMLSQTTRFRPRSS